MTILGPLLMAGIWVVPFLISNIKDGQKTVQVLDETNLFADKFVTNQSIRYLRVIGDIERAKKNYLASGDHALIYIPRTELSVPVTVVLYATSQPSMDVKSTIKEIVKKQVEALKLNAKGIDPEVLASIKTSIKVNTITLNDDGSEKSSFIEVSIALGLTAGIIIYMLILVFGAQVMRGVIEEKTNRIVEVIISSVKPFELMMGKIIGVGLVGLTQFLLWVVLTFSIITVFQISYGSGSEKASEPGYNAGSKLLGPQQLAQYNDANEQEEDTVNQIMKAMESVDFPLILISFVLYFIGGYLLYSSLYAAIGAASESETDTQQFMLPVTVPLIFSMVMMSYVINNPFSKLSVWLSIIPFTSPIIMMIRIPFSVPVWQVVVSLAVLIASFVFTTWLAARIYRTGILMYGKKVNYKEVWKWLKYKD
jgi:ABC-2 type transport system permease protein